MKYLLSVVLSCSVISFFGQSQNVNDAECIRMLKQAQDYSVKGRYESAIKKLSAVAVHCQAMVNLVNERLLKIYTDINNAKQNEQKQRLLAVQQTNIAVQEKKVAQRQTYLAQLSAMSSTITLLNKEDPTLALRLAQLAFEKNATAENAHILHELVSDTNNIFYKFRLRNYSRDLAYSDSANELFVALINKIIVYDTDGRQKRVIDLGSDFNGIVAISPNTRNTITISSDSITKLSLYGNEQKSVKQKILDKRLVDKARWSRDGKYIIISYKDEFVVYDTFLTSIYTYRNTKMVAFDIGPDLQYFAISDGENILIGDTSSENNIQDTIREPYVYGIAISPQKEKIYTTYYRDNKVKVWDGDPLPVVFEAHNSMINSINFSSNDDYVLTSDEGGVSILWSDDGDILKTLRTAGHKKFKSIINKASTAVVTQSDNEICFWNIDQNPLGSIEKLYRNFLYYRNLSVVDVFEKRLILRNGNELFENKDGTLTNIKFQDSTILYEATFAGATENILLSCADSMVLLNQRTANFKTLVSRKNANFNYSVNDKGDILIRHDSTLFLFDKNGNHLRQRIFQPYIFNAAITSDGQNAFVIGYKSIYLVNLTTGKEKYISENNLNIDDEYPNKIICSQSGNLILAIYLNKSVLMDATFNHLKTYLFESYIKHARFSKLEDSIYFISSFGVDIRLTNRGIEETKNIYKLSISDKLKYNVPYVLEEVIKNRDWKEFDECVFYYFSNYLRKENEEYISIIKYLSSHEHNYFKENIEYYLNLQGRISFYSQIISTAQISNYELLKEILQTIIFKLEKEKSILKPRVIVIGGPDNQRFIWK